jgi:hypothetical protein
MGHPSMKILRCCKKQHAKSFQKTPANPLHKKTAMVTEENAMEIFMRSNPLEKLARVLYFF